MSTLKRETSPQQGFQPSLLPQHEGGTGEYLPTGESNPLPTKMNESVIIVPVFNEGRAVQDIQTHTGVTIAPNSWNAGSWIDSHVEGSPLSYLGVTVNMTSGTGMKINIELSHDGTNKFTYFTLHDGTLPEFAEKDDVKLNARWFRVAIQNKDASVPKVTTAYSRLKA